MKSNVSLRLLRASSATDLFGVLIQLLEEEEEERGRGGEETKREQKNSSQPTWFQFGSRCETLDFITAVPNDARFHRLRYHSVNFHPSTPGATRSSDPSNTFKLPGLPHRSDVAASRAATSSSYRSPCEGAGERGRGGRRGLATASARERTWAIHCWMTTFPGALRVSALGQRVAATNPAKRVRFPLTANTIDDCPEPLMGLP
ncbi:unnamed protein product [Lampetra fluviatilis]